MMISATQNIVVLDMTSWIYIFFKSKLGIENKNTYLKILIKCNPKDLIISNKMNSKKSCWTKIKYLKT